jgi:hypothetical protein
VHFDNILQQSEGGGDIFRDGSFSFWQISRNGLRLDRSG